MWLFQKQSSEPYQLTVSTSHIDVSPPEVLLRASSAKASITRSNVARINDLLRCRQQTSPNSIGYTICFGRRIVLVTFMQYLKRISRSFM
jgi:hypothetical protein